MRQVIPTLFELEKFCLFFPLPVAEEREGSVLCRKIEATGPLISLSVELVGTGVDARRSSRNSLRRVERLRIATSWRRADASSTGMPLLAPLFGVPTTCEGLGATIVCCWLGCSREIGGVGLGATVVCCWVGCGMDRVTPVDGATEDSLEISIGELFSVWLPTERARICDSRVAVFCEEKGCAGCGLPIRRAATSTTLSVHRESDVAVTFSSSVWSHCDVYGSNTLVVK